MCGRVFQTYNVNQLLLIAGTHLIQNSDKYTPSYNICPGEYLPVIKRTKDSEENNRVLDIMVWGYKPVLSLLFNARAEDPQKKKLFKGLVNTRRCAVIVEGYYEWSATQTPFAFRPKKKMTQSPEQEAPLHLLIAGFYSHDGSVVILTRESVGEAKKAHNRMPVLLDNDEVDMWLDCDKYKYEDIQANILDDEKEKWKSTFCYQLTQLVNNKLNKSANVLMKADEYDTKAENSTIKKFFSSSGKKSNKTTSENSYTEGRRGDETDFEYSDAEEEEVKTQKEEKMSKDKPKGPEFLDNDSSELIKIELRHSPRRSQAKKVQKGGKTSKSKESENSDEMEVTNTLQKKEEKGTPSKLGEDGLQKTELKHMMEDVKFALEEAGIDLGRKYKVKQTIVVVEKKEENTTQESNKENVEISASKASQTSQTSQKESETQTENKTENSEKPSKKRKSSDGTPDSTYTPNPKKMKQNQAPLNLRN